MSRPRPRRSPSPSPPPPSYRRYLQCIDRTCRPNVPKYELTSFYASNTSDPEASSTSALSCFVRDMYAYFYDRLPDIDAVVGLDALGLPPAAGLAVLADKPLIVIRKAGKLALEAHELARSEPLYRGDQVLEVRRDLVPPGIKVLVVDEWVDSGAQMTSACRLLESLGATVGGIGTLQLTPGRMELADALRTKWDVFAANAAAPQPGVEISLRLSHQT